MKTVFLSANGYDNPNANNGDCIIVDNGTEMVVYDCGCQEHAMRVEEIMKTSGYKSVKVVLSHNDADHFNGIPYLVDNGLVSSVYTLLLLKYKDDLLKLINDKRRTRDSIANSIADIYDNIYSLGGKVALKDIFTDTYVASGISIPGPGKDYALKAVAKNIDSREGDNIDKETIVNAVSTQLSVSFGYGKNLLLTGDSSFKAIEESIKNHQAIQLPHHGKLDQAEEIFKVKDNTTLYFVSDNTGDSNGGSSNLPKRGHIIMNTLSGDQDCTYTTFSLSASHGSYFGA